MSFPRYPKYKDSGVEWLEEVPGSRANGPASFGLPAHMRGRTVGARIEGQRPASFQPGATPQVRCRPMNSGLKARSIFLMKDDRPRDGPRFQRSNGKWLVSWGVAPGWYKSAPLALNRYRSRERGVPPPRAVDSGPAG